MKNNLNKFSSISKIFYFLYFNVQFKTNLLNAEDFYFNEIEIDSSTKFDDSSLSLPY